MKNEKSFSNLRDSGQAEIQGRDFSENLNDLSAVERRTLIAQMAIEKGKVLLSELVEQFQITETSIRRDLVILESKGMLKQIGRASCRERVLTSV
jgi:predicted HTH transcriptional regulator